MKLILLASLLLLALPMRQATADENALWHIVSEQCVPQQKLTHSPHPCELVDLAAGYAVLKDIVGNTQFLLIPTKHLRGIESAELLAPSAPNYWQDAWQARRFVEQRARHQLPRDALGLAINSQSQLHIHIDCVRLDVTAALRSHAGVIGEHWAKFPVPLVSHEYLAMRLNQPDLSANPFVLLADGISGARADMAHWTLVVIGARWQDKDGFVLLAGHATPASGNWGEGEQLQDHSCAAATAASR
jgi:CDP-diacylglycerol pyrophosphatase